MLLSQFLTQRRRDAFDVTRQTFLGTVHKWIAEMCGKPYSDNMLV